jgi:RHS repeat-associated protein
LSTNYAPFGKTTIFSYLSITNDERLSEIWNQKTNSVTLSKFDYSYDPVGNITNWMEQTDANTPTVAVMQYDPINQLLNSTTFSNTVAGPILKQYACSYDLSGNRSSEQIGTTTNAPVNLSQSFYNNDDQVTNRISASGPLMFAGSISRQGTVIVAGIPATINHFTTNFLGYSSVTNGTNVVPVIATDYGNHSRTNNYQVVLTNNGVAEILTYDLDGNLTCVVTATSTNTYQWDAANRLISIAGPTNQSQFTYDGLGKRVQIIEETNGVTYATNKFVWDGQTLVEQRDLTGGTVTKRFFGQGEQISGTNYYFTRDHLGSVREMTDSSGAIKVRYDYDPYGRQTTVSGTVSADFGYARMYIHQPSGLNLTLYRAYNADLGRWLSRDPMGENANLNLYEYVANNPIGNLDLFGLQVYPGSLPRNFNPVIPPVYPTEPGGGLSPILIPPGTPPGAPTIGTPTSPPGSPGAPGKSGKGDTSAGAAAGGMEMAGGFLNAGSQNRAWNQAISDCSKTPPSMNGCCKCCVVTFTTLANTPDPNDYYYTSGFGFVEDMPCSQAESQAKSQGTLSPAGSITQYVNW